MKLQYLTVIFVIIMLPIVLVLSQYVGIQVDTISTKTKLDTSLLGATYDTMAAYEFNTRNTSNSSVVSEDIREIEAVISTFTRSLSSSMGLTGVAKDYILSYVPAIAFCMYDGYYIYMPNETTSGDEKLQPYVYYTKNYINDDTNTNITIAYSLDNYVSIYGKCNNKPVSAAGYLVVPGDVTINNFSYVTTTAEDGGVEYKVLSGKISYKGIEIKKEKVFENKTVKNLKTTRMGLEETTDAMIYYYQANKFTLFYNDVIDQLKPQDKAKLKILTTNNPESETSAFNDEKVNVIKDAVTSNLNRAIYNFEGVNKDVYEMPQLNGEDWDKILNNISIIAFMKDMPLNNATTYNNYVVVNSTITQKYTSAKSIKFIGYDSGFNSKGYYHKITCEDFLKDIKDGTISNIIGYSAVDFERYKGAAENEREYYYYYKHNEYADYDCEIEGKSSVNIAILDGYLDSKAVSGLAKENIERAYYTAVGRIRFRQAKASSYINLENRDTDKFTVTYNLNGGEWSISGEDPVTIESKYQKIEIPRETPKKIGETFNGWKVAGSLTTDKIAKSGDILYSSSNLTLIAQYGNAYTITYYDFDNNEYKKQTKLEDINLELIRETPTKEGYIFTGWEERTSGGLVYDAIYMNDISRWVITDNRNINLYPKSEDQKYQIKYRDAKGMNIKIVYKKRGDNYIIESLGDRPGATFRGWGLELEGNEVKYTPGESITVDANLTLYAKWTNTTYKIIFNKNDGSGTTDTRIVHIDTPFFKPNYTRSGFGFGGWRSADGTIEPLETYDFITESFINKYFPGSVTEVQFYAIWGSTAWTMTFADDSGDSTVTGIPSISIMGNLNINTSKYEITLRSEDIQTPTRTNYRFLYWDDHHGHTFTIGETYIYDKVQENLTVYAVWERTKITITYYSDDDKTNQKTYNNVDAGRVRLKTEIEAEEEMEFYGEGILAHWKDKIGNIYDPGYNGNIYEPGYNIENQYEDLELYAVWSSFEADYGYYRIFYTPNTEAAVDGLPDPQQVDKTNPHTTILTIEPTRAGHTFKGWTNIKDGTEEKEEFKRRDPNIIKSKFNIICSMGNK